MALGLVRSEQQEPHNIDVIKGMSENSPYTSYKIPTRLAIYGMNKAQTIRHKKAAPGSQAARSSLPMLWRLVR